MTNATALPLPALATQQQMTQDEDVECAEGDGDKGLQTGLRRRGLAWTRTRVANEGLVAAFRNADSADLNC